MNAKTGTGPRLSARERLLAAAGELFYENGINTVGIDRVIEHAGVAKASLYDCFGSKEELIRSYLEERSRVRQARIEERLSKYRELIEALRVSRTPRHPTSSMSSKRQHAA